MYFSPWMYFCPLQVSVAVLTQHTAGLRQQLPGTENDKWLIQAVWEIHSLCGAFYFGESA